MFISVDWREHGGSHSIICDTPETAWLIYWMVKKRAESSYDTDPVFLTIMMGSTFLDPDLGTCMGPCTAEIARKQLNPKWKQ